MDTLRIDIINPRVKDLLHELADLKLIRIRDESYIQDLANLLKRLRSKADQAPGDDEITAIVEETRRERYETR